MNLKLTLHVLGGMLIAMGALLLTPIAFAIYYDDGEIDAFIASSASTNYCDISRQCKRPSR